ncbi:MAG: DUF72 domain-containing protein [Thaumarchaeota archaeon]|nr:DUF72 domain-containing protein [Nitrososphaerota archaeon]
MSNNVREKMHTGCSGWSYQDWVGPFYPKGTKPKDYLRLYSSVLDAVEIDSSFYRIPNQFMISQWKKNTPEGFIFCPKVPKKITHELKLQNISNNLSFFYRTTAGLGSKLGPMVFQMPPSFKYEKGMKDLENLLSKEIKDGFRHAIEFRHKSWFRSEVYKLLESHNVALCWSLNQYIETPTLLTSNFVYARMVGERDITDFSTTQKDRSKESKDMADAIKSVEGSIEEGFIFFNNHFAGFGPESVNEFRRLSGLMELDYSKLNALNSGFEVPGAKQASLTDY